jgi:tetratricopeptide (TPR) repeat protein
MQEEVRARIVHFEQQVLEVDARKKSRKHGEALALLAEVRVGCADSTAAESLEKELKTIIAEQDNSLEKAKIFEREGEYEKAIKIHDIYSDPSTISGLLEKYGNQREGKGDFVGAAAAYEKANRKNLALSLKEKVNTQINEYKRAEKMSSNGEYDQAAEIYKKYADEEKLSGIELKKNRGGTESGNLLDWLRDFEARRGKLGKTDDIFSELAEAAGEALRGSVEAGHYVGCMMTMNGKQMQNKKMFEGGLMFLEKAALKGHALSACELGIALVKGYSGDTAWDEKKGKEWLRKSADEGIQKAREELIRLEKSNTKKAAKSASTKNSESDEFYISEEIRKWRNGGREKAIQQAIRDFKSHPNTAVVNESLIIEMVDGNFQKTLQMMRAMGPSNFRKEFGSSPEP